MTEPMEFRPDPNPDLPDTFIIDGVRFSGALLRAMTRPDPKHTCSFERKDDRVHVTRVDVSAQFEMLKEQLRIAREVRDKNKRNELKAIKMVGDISVERESCHKANEVLGVNLKLANEKIGGLKKRLATARTFPCQECGKDVEVERVTCGACKGE